MCWTGRHFAAEYGESEMEMEIGAIAVAAAQHCEELLNDKRWASC
jgi:hypothetical protein